MLLLSVSMDLMLQEHNEAVKVIGIFIKKNSFPNIDVPRNYFYCRDHLFTVKFDYFVV